MLPRLESDALEGAHSGVARLDGCRSDQHPLYPLRSGCDFMIDNLEKTGALMERMQAALPMRAGFGRELKGRLMETCPEALDSGHCEVTKIHYLGDLGGILCHLDFGIPDSKEVYITSITHLAFDRGKPLSREIAVYQKHRVKRLRKLQGRGF